MPIAILRTELAKLDCVKDSWFEWEFEADSRTKTLVVEVKFDTDPNEYDFDSGSLDDVYETVIDTLKNKTTMVISKVRVVPSRK